MSIQILQLFNCPFCRGKTGQIMVDAAALAAYRRKPNVDPSPCIGDAPDQNVLVFNSDSRDSGPCQHLLDVLVDFDLWSELPNNRVGDRWGASYDWYHPKAREMDARGYLRDFFLELRHGWDLCASEDHDLPPYRVIRRRLGWRDFATKGTRKRHCEAEGTAVFVRDVATFLSELRTQYRQHVSATRKMQKT
jgi:hypothetical protein